MEDSSEGSTNEMAQQVWKPHPRQEEALRRIEFEILYGGARGGGKTDAGLVWLTDHIDKPGYRALVIRKNADDLSDWVDRASRMYSLLRAKTANRPPVITFPSGAIIRTGHLKDDQAYTKYQGHEYQRILIEELTQIPDEKRYLQLLASCRSLIPEIRPQVFCTTNPGGVGHGWVKRRFVDPVPPNSPYRDPTSGRSRIYIPARVDDNPTLVAADPGYISFLESLKDTDVELWKAWRQGDWDTFAGQFFKEWRPALHVIRPFIPKLSDKLVIGGMDWGRAKPFSSHLSTVEKVFVKDFTPFYRVKTFLEVYGTDRTPQAWNDIMKERMSYYQLSLNDVEWVRGDPAMWTKGQDNSKAIADQFIDADERWRSKLKPGSNDRVGGWENMHQWLSIAPDGLPYWQISDQCHNLIRTLPELVHDELKVEDVDTEGEDHAADDQRYQFKHLKWIDGRVGGAKQNSAQPKNKFYFASMSDDGRQISIDPDLFGAGRLKR